MRKRSCDPTESGLGGLFIHRQHRLESKCFCIGPTPTNHFLFVHFASVRQKVKLIIIAYLFQRLSTSLFDRSTRPVSDRSSVDFEQNKDLLCHKITSDGVLYFGHRGGRFVGKCEPQDAVANCLYSHLDRDYFFRFHH